MSICVSVGCINIFMYKYILYASTCVHTETSKSIRSVFLVSFLPGFQTKDIVEPDALQLASLARQ